LSEDELKELSIKELNFVNERRKDKGLPEIKKTAHNKGFVIVGRKCKVQG
jgi:hypothetical protein